ncbi:hypothetical protein BGZ81_009239 [Podila clonocystis]|nr:hypothetical protein BGZ81_009239 [Podila clonocystis]
MTAASLNPFNYLPHQPQPLLGPFNLFDPVSPSSSSLANLSPADTMFSPSLTFRGVRQSKRNASSMDPVASEHASNKRHSPSPPQASSLLCTSTSNATSSVNKTKTDNTISPSEPNAIPTFTITNTNASFSSSSSSSSPLLSQNTHAGSTKARTTKPDTSSNSTTTSPTKPLQFINKVAPVVSRPVEPIGPYVQSQSAIRQKARKQIREEGKIKRYSNCFIKYRTDMHPRIVGQYGHQNNKEISRLAGIWWRNESEEVKRIYRKQAQDEKLKHASIYPNYKYTPAKVAQPKSESLSATEGGVEKSSGRETQTDKQVGHSSTSAGTPEGELKKRKEKPKEKPYFVNETPLHAFNGDTDGNETLKKGTSLRKRGSESRRRPDLLLDPLPPPENDLVLNQSPGNLAATSLSNSLGSLQTFDAQVGLLEFVSQGVLDDFDQLSNVGPVNSMSPFSWANPYSEQWNTSLSPMSMVPLDADLSMPTVEVMANSIMTSMSPSEQMTTSGGHSSPFWVQMGETTVQIVEVRPQSLPQQVPSTPPVAQLLTSVDGFPWSDFTSSIGHIPTSHPLITDARTSRGTMAISSLSRPMVMPLESHLTGNSFQLQMEPIAPVMPIVRLDGNSPTVVGKESFLLQDTSDGTWVQGPSTCAQHVHNLNNTIGNNSSLPTDGSQVLQGFSFTPVTEEWTMDKRLQLLKSSNIHPDQQQQQHQCHDPFLPSECNGSLDLCSPRHQPRQQQGAIKSSTILLPQTLDGSNGFPDSNREEELSMNIEYLERLVQQRKMQLFFQQQQRLATQQFQQP